ncbi:hypothetical protein ALQ20_02646 [Pseudomonas syringae pv. atrofaciens]|nr:hypothetical protein ALQ20_02646 [Pseudomonas syringae pv. atrofaciens]
MAGHQSQPPSDFPGQVGQSTAGVIQHVENLVGARQQGASGLGQTDFAAQAVEQAHVELLLQTGNPLADGRLGQVKAFACPGEAAGLGNGNKGIKVGQVHGQIPVGYPKYENYEFELFKHIP